MEENEEKKYNSRVKIIIAVLITAIITFCCTVFWYGKYLSKNGLIINSYESSEDIADDLDVLRSYIDYYYKGDVDEKALKESALKGYVDGLGDEYTEFMTKSEWDSLNAMLSQSVGIGVYLVEYRGGEVVIAETVEGAPAANAGLMPGDIIKELNLEDVSTKGSEYISSKIKNGAEGTTVKIKVLRGEEELVFDVERAEVRYYKIKHEMLENNIGYIDFDSFTDTSYQEFFDAYTDLKNNNAKALIIDLRGNTGGQVDQVLNIADLFVESGKPLIITEDKNGNRVTNTSKNDKVIDMPVVVLVNDYTASASEILTGILKDYKLATVIGTKTYGKGVIQNVYQDILGEGSGVALKITTAEYFTPNGNRVHKEGIEPDEVIDMTEAELLETEEDGDIQLQRAIEILK